MPWVGNERHNLPFRKMLCQRLTCVLYVLGDLDVLFRNPLPPSLIEVHFRSLQPSSNNVQGKYPGHTRRGRSQSPASYRQPHFLQTKSLR